MKDKRVHRHKTDYGITDYRKFYNKKYEKNISAKEFSKIITEFNKALIDLIIEESVVYQLPYIGMEVMIKKMKITPKIINGKLVNNRPVDWKKTNKLWKENLEAKEKKLLIRHSNTHTSGYTFRIYLKKFKCNLKNRKLYQLKANRYFKNKLRDRINNKNKDSFDAFLLY